MKKFKRILGIGIISIPFIGVFMWMAQDSSLELALKTWGITLGITAAIVIGVLLLDLK